ncbi:hypothetical protein NDU88_005095 [Pleurodeles waltl]|uniref:Uncharacterized protein n=1 Tax=Pleurodeles waltl TaxID=8319 RepID=A0AAV7NPK2_PLEWA|nr:hypothetical protein NDU88_005095 [Pleurodeles waltl]
MDRAPQVSAGRACLGAAARRPRVAGAGGRAFGPEDGEGGGRLVLDCSVVAAAAIGTSWRRRNHAFYRSSLWDPLTAVSGAAPSLAPPQRPVVAAFRPPP